MRTETWKRVNRFNRVASKSSWIKFWELIEGCCLHHEDNEIVRTCLDICQKRDGRSLLLFADSLLTQKYVSAKEHFLANQLSALIRKYPYSSTEVKLDPEGTAIRSFLRSEHRCKRINQLFRKMRLPHKVPVRFSRDYQSRLSTMRNWITYVLGNNPSIEDVFSGVDFGPGASIGVHGNATNIGRKLLAEKWSVTSDAFTYASQAVGAHAQLRELVLSEPEHTLYCADPILFDERFRKRCEVVHNNKIVFVPKTAMTHRSIAVEPLLNGFLQKGVDVLMRRRMKRVGIDLSDQTVNQRFARIGSISGSEGLCTIDLSAASDSMATEVVRELLPPEWFALLNALRSKTGSLLGRKLSYEKFCSMGNGFCFPLESLIFASAVVEAGGKLGINSSVYGDDIIVPPSIFKRVLANLKLLGFSVNAKKTFSEGPFRESCGADWFNGEDVRPFTLDFRIDSLSAVFKLLNLTQRNERTKSFFSWLTFDFLNVPADLRFVRPFDGPADSAVTVELDAFLGSPFASYNRRNGCYRWKELLNEAVEDHGLNGAKQFNIALLYGALRGCSSSKPFTVRRKSRTKVGVKTGSGALATWVPAPSDT